MLHHEAAACATLHGSAGIGHARAMQSPDKAGIHAPWVAALGATLLMQSVSSFLTQTLPVVAPLITASAGLAPERVGNLSSLVAFGTVLFLLLGGPFLARLGPVRMLQAGALLSGIALLIAALGALPALMLASLLLGVGYGPSPPAGSRILAATAPKRHRTLIFSVKQAGAPLGGAMAGLIAARYLSRPWVNILPPPGFPRAPRRIAHDEQQRHPGHLPRLLPPQRA